uniref:Uncharacterized protein n=1 Tax=Palpitomonas bilix TaxID=652834 RepID=A0A7S3G3Y7_9EUKA|mmetsp:Transcript_19939/g.50932  ORF Transcript_19939/g.50932 Transcript_19939/m.50932 type:complete len:319 (+) Transcript_19939:92-1048(+)
MKVTAVVAFALLAAAAAMPISSSHHHKYDILKCYSGIEEEPCGDGHIQAHCAYAPKNWPTCVVGPCPHEYECCDKDGCNPPKYDKLSCYVNDEKEPCGNGLQKAYCAYNPAGEPTCLLGECLDGYKCCDTDDCNKPRWHAEELKKSYDMLTCFDGPYKRLCGDGFHEAHCAYHEIDGSEIPTCVEGSCPKNFKCCDKDECNPPKGEVLECYYGDKKVPCGDGVQNAHCAYYTETSFPTCVVGSCRDGFDCCDTNLCNAPKLPVLECYYGESEKVPCGDGVYPAHCAYAPNGMPTCVVQECPYGFDCCDKNLCNPPKKH